MGSLRCSPIMEWDGLSDSFLVCRSFPGYVLVLRISFFIDSSLALSKLIPFPVPCQCCFLQISSLLVLHQSSQHLHHSQIHFVIIASYIHRYFKNYSTFDDLTFFAWALPPFVFNGASTVSLSPLFSPIAFVCLFPFVESWCCEKLQTQISTAATD